VVGGGGAFVCAATASGRAKVRRRARVFMGVDLGVVIREV
jgi:hypothetical protein